MKITIKNFNTYNPRKDLKSMPWMRLQNNFYDMEDFFDESVETTWLFVFLLCQCAQKVNGSIDMKEHYLIAKSKLTKKAFHSALIKLESKDVILLEKNESEQARTNPNESATNERTNEHNEHGQTVRTSGKIDFDFDLIWKAHPKRVKKKQGFEILNKLIKTQEDFDKALFGAKNYKEYCSKNETEDRFIKTFNLWCKDERWNDEIVIEKSFDEKMLDFIRGE